MMNSRRAPTSRVPFLNMECPGGQSIANVCQCRSLEDLVKLWDVKWTIPLPTTDVAAIAGTTTPSSDMSNWNADEEVLGDLHHYDDRYFFDAKKFRKERSDAVDVALSSSGNVETVQAFRNEGKKVELLSSKGDIGENEVENEREDAFVIKRPKL